LSFSSLFDLSVEAFIDVAGAFLFDFTGAYATAA
jgi:hypothetical protein